MRPLVHPSIEDISVEGIMHALSDPVRAAIFADIAMSKCSQICSSFSSVDDKSIPKSTLSQHFKALREAGLIRSERHGVEMHNRSRCDEIEVRFPGLLPAIISAHRMQHKFRERASKAALQKASRQAKSGQVKARQQETRQQGTRAGTR